MKIIVNTIESKRIAGGVFQISINFLLKTLSHSEVEWYYFTSSDVDEEVGASFVQIKNIKYFVFPSQPDFKGSYYKVRKQLKELEKNIAPDIIYSISAPGFFSFNSLEVMRCTDPWVTHPNKYSWSALPIKSKICYYIHAKVSKFLIKRGDYFITQTETCAKGLRRIAVVPADHVKVVHNVLPAAFSNMEPTSIVNNSNTVNIAAVGNSVFHKNFNIIPQVLKHLIEMGHNNVFFHTTLPEDSLIWKKMEYDLMHLNILGHVVNHGRVSQLELGDMYRRCQFCFLPTLLEVFSASTVEAMYFQLPIVATDFNFNTEVLEDSCLYYEPQNAKDAALLFSKLIDDEKLQNELKDKMKKRLLLFESYDVHFNEILNFLIKVSNHELS